jgi:hypothetical protein
MVSFQLIVPVPLYGLSQKVLNYLNSNSKSQFHFLGLDVRLRMCLALDARRRERTQPLGIIRGYHTLQEITSF